VTPPASHSGPVADLLAKVIRGFLSVADSGLA